MSSHPHDHEVWGDSPEERDADAVVAEIAAETPAIERRWHHHPAIVPFKAVVLFVGRNAKRVAVTIAGVAVILLGVAMLVLPGPGIIVIVAGLAILATEYIWARRLLETAKQKAEQAKDKVLRKKGTRQEKKEGRRPGTS
jgi:uncharacterized protein (TIGR02611 family)